MAQQTIPQLPDRDDGIDGDMFLPADDTVQTYRVTVNELKDFIANAMQDQIDAAVDAKMKILVPTGTTMAWWSTEEPEGWLILADYTIGNASSGADFADNIAEDLFKYLWANINNTNAPVFTSAGSPTVRGESGAADWAANKRIQLPGMEALAMRGIGSRTVNARTKFGPTDIGAIEEDQGQGHQHTYDDAYLSGTTSDAATGSSPQSVPRNGTTSNGALIGWSGNGRVRLTNSLSTQNTSAPTTNGSNGAPRMGTETRVNSRGVNWCIKL